MGRAAGLTELDLADLDAFETSDTYDEVDRLALRLASAMSATPAETPDELREAGFSDGVFCAVPAHEV